MSTVPDAKDLHDKLIAAEVYARRQGMLDIQNQLAESRIWCERRMGQLLNINPDISRGGSKYRGETLKPLRVTRVQSHRWQYLAQPGGIADVPAEFELSRRRDNSKAQVARLGPLGDENEGINRYTARLNAVQAAKLAKAIEEGLALTFG